MAERLNRYVCRACGGSVVTVDRAEGVTPFYLDCYATEGCGGPMMSSFYRVDGTPLPVLEFYSPDKAERKRLDVPTREHVRLGGLLVRRIPVARLADGEGGR